MAISSSTRKLLGDFVERMAVKPAENIVGFGFGFKSGKIPSAISPELAAQSIALHITDEEFWLYQQCLKALSHERELEHLTRYDVERGLWEFTCDLSVNWAKYKTTKAKSKRIAEFLASFARPLKDFEVLFTIDGIAAIENAFTVRGVTLCQFTEQDVAAWNFQASRWANEWRGLFVNKAVAKVAVSAGSSSKAVDRAKHEIDTALNLLRVGVSGGFRRVRIWDWQLLQRRGTHHLVRELATGDVRPLGGWERWFEPQDMEFVGPVLQQSQDFLQKVGRILDGTLPVSLGEQLLRAMEWIGSSHTREHYDDKVVDLCTALEAMLATKSDRMKGEAISVRMMTVNMALDKPFSHPARLLALYELRSSIVHGAGRNVSGEKDYLLLRDVAIEVLLRCVELVQRDNSITRPSQLITKIEEVSLLERARDWLSNEPDQFSQRLAGYVQARLDDLSKT